MSFQVPDIADKQAVFLRYKLKRVVSFEVPDIADKQAVFVRYKLKE